jgi:hypothetical protein
VTDKCRIREAKVLEQLGYVIGPSVDVVSVPGLIGATMATAVVCNYAVSAVGEEVHLKFPIVGVEGPTVAEEDGLAGGVAPVFVEKTHTVFEGKVWHFSSTRLLAIYLGIGGGK